MNENISIKKNLEEKLYEVLTKGLYKYIKRIYKKKKEEYENDILVYKNFQKKLYKIAKWSNDTITTEYSNILSWCKRHYDIDEQKMELMLKNIILLSTQIMINRSKIYTENFLSTYEFPLMKTMYYKCLKKIARIFYENPKSIYDISLYTLKENLQPLFYNIIPIKKITDYLEIKRDSVIVEKKVIEYNFNKDDTDDTDDTEDKDDKHGIIQYDHDNKKDFCENLKYICSEDFNENIENIENTNKNQSNENKDEDDNDNDNIKHIRIPKLNKMYLKKKTDNIDEHFFD